MTLLNHILLLSAVSLAIIHGCTNPAPNSFREEPVTFERAKSVVPSLLTTDEIADLVKYDTTHRKVVYYFDLYCKPCRAHLASDLSAMYADRDTAQWRFYLVAGFNWLHRLVPNEDGIMVEDTLANFRHYAKQYRKVLTSLGYDWNDVYLHYDPSWEHTHTGVFTPLAQRMFHSDSDFHCKHEGSPQLFKSDRHNRLQTDRVTHLNNAGDTLEVFYAPNDDYTLDTHHFYSHQPITSSW